MERAKAFGTAIASVLLGGGALALAGFGLASAAPHQAALACQPTSMGNCTLTISSYPDALAGEHGANGGAHPDWVSYSNDNLVVPANTTVHMVIKQYDSGGALNNPFFGHVWGTSTGTATYTYPTTTGSTTTYGKPQTVSSVDPNNVGHTFTLRGIPGNASPLFVSVPLPADAATNSISIGSGTYSSPILVSFTFKTGSAGVYEWNCEFPCGGSREGQFGAAMSSYGYMSGTITVK